MTDEFTTDYLQTWTEPDRAKRRARIDAMWSGDGAMAVSATGTTLRGRDAIAAHIAVVHEQSIAGRGLRFVYDQSVPSGDALLLRWSMLAPDGGVVGRGADVLFRDAAGRVERAYMFMGVA